MSTCDFTIDVRIVAPDGATETISLEDESAGYVTVNEIPTPQWDESAPRVTGAYVHGDAPGGLSTVEVGFLPVTVEVSGSTWVECQSRVAALEEAWRADEVFYVDVEVEGVTTRYQAERSSWRPEPITAKIIAAATQEVALVFRVQPFPLTDVGES